MGGIFSSVDHQSRLLFAAYSLSGDSLLPYRITPDTSYHDAAVYAIKPHGADKLFIGGYLNYRFSGSPTSIVEFDINKMIVTTWHPQYSTGYVLSMDVSQDGKIVAYSDESAQAVSVNDVATGNLLYRISAFYMNDGINRGLPYSIKAVGNSFYIAGVFNRVTDASGNQAVRNGVCSINMSTGFLQNFNLNLNTGCARYVDAYNGNLIVSGPFTQAGDSAREHLVMVDTGTNAINPWNPAPSDELKTISFSGGKVFLGGIFNGIQSAHRNGLAAFDASTGAVLPFNPPINTTIIATVSSKKMAIQGDTLFLLGHSERLNTSGTEATTLQLYSRSTGMSLASPLAYNTTIHDFLLDGGYLYVADEFSVRRYILPAMSLDVVWKADFSYGITNYLPQYLCKDSTNVYSVGDSRVPPPGYFQSSFNYACLSKIDKVNSSTITTWSYKGAVAHFDRAVLADSLIFVQGEFSSLNGITARSVASINVKNGNMVNWSPPFRSVGGLGIPQPFSYANKIFLTQGALWFGQDYLHTEYPLGWYPDPAHPLVFGAIDSVSGLVLPSPVTISGKVYSDLGYDPDDVISSYISVNDFLFDPDYAIVVGNFDFINGQMHQSIVRLSYSSYSPPSGHLAISGPDTVATNSDSVSYSLPDNLAYTWAYSGANTTLVDSDQNPVLLSFGPGATGGVLSAKGTGYCGVSNIAAQKNIVVIHVFPSPTANACCMVFPNRQADRISLSFAPGNGNGRLVIASASPVATVPKAGTAYMANANFGAGADLGGGNFVVSAGADDSLIVIGLQPSTRYYFTVFEYDGAADSLRYLTSNAYVSYESTLSGLSPSVGSSNLHFTNITANSANVICTPGNGQERLFVIRATGPVNDTPVDGLNYSPDPIFGDGSDLGNKTYAVADQGDSITITGLAPATTYYVAVFEVNGAGNNTLYLVNPFLSRSFITDSTATAVNWQDSSLSVKVFPNPVGQNCFIQVQSNESTNMTVAVYGISGKQVNSYSFRVSQGNNIFELKDFAMLSKGMYILKLRIGSHKVTVKIFKE